jgi:hypothetical protein
VRGKTARYNHCNLIEKSRIPEGRAGVRVEQEETMRRGTCAHFRIVARVRTAGWLAAVLAFTLIVTSCASRPHTASRPPDAASETPPSPVAQPKDSIPAFEWPPPRPSAQYVLPRSVFGDGTRELLFADIDRILVDALRAGGYNERSYYSVPDGFALATRIEQISADGSPKVPPARFALQPEAVSLLRPMDYLRALLKGVPGYYRVIVFIVTEQPFTASGQAPSEEVATGWVSSGVNVLPRQLGARRFTSDVHCTALIYEFERQPGSDASATKFALPGRLDAMTHLTRSGIWSGLHAR